MGMILHLASVDTATLELISSDEDQLEAILFPEHGDPPNSVDMDKAWHAIHFMLTGSAGEVESPLGLALLGGEPVGEDIGYGPARILQADQVKQVAIALKDIDDQQFKSRYAPEDMVDDGVYLSETFASEGTEGLDYILGNYQSLVAFYQDAAARGDGVLIWIG